MAFPDVVDRLLARYPALLTRHPSVMQQLAQISGDKEREIKRELQRTDPFESHEVRVAAAERSLRAEAQTSGQLAQDIDAYAGFLQQTNLASDLVYWTAERKLVESVKSGGDDGEARKARALLIRNWRKKLDQARTAWELQQIQSLRDAYMEELLRWLGQLELIEWTLDQLGIEPGRLLDFSNGTLSPQDMEQLTRWARYLKGDANVQALCALLGRAWQQERSSKLEKVQRQLTFQTLLPDVHSREELVGIEFGKDVSHAIPAEWMLLADSASETLFDLKLAESRLLCFRMEGIQAVTQDREEEHSVEDKTRSDHRLRRYERLDAGGPRARRQSNGVVPRAADTGRGAWLLSHQLFHRHRRSRSFRPVRNGDTDEIPADVVPWRHGCSASVGSRVGDAPLRTF